MTTADRLRQLKEERCRTCDGKGWIAVRRDAHGLHGTFEIDCPECAVSAIDNLVKKEGGE